MLLQGLLLLVHFIQLGQSNDETDLDSMYLPPNHLMIFYASRFYSNQLPDCHGMLLNENHALTGATCITNFNTLVLKKPAMAQPKNQYFYAFTVFRVGILTKELQNIYFEQYF